MSSDHLVFSGVLLTERISEQLYDQKSLFLIRRLSSDQAARSSDQAPLSSDHLVFCGVLLTERISEQLFDQVGLFLIRRRGLLIRRRCLLITWFSVVLC